MSRRWKIAWSGVAVLAAVLSFLIAGLERDAERSRSALRSVTERHRTTEAELRKLRDPAALRESPAAVLTPANPPARAVAPAPSEGETLNDIAARRRTLLRGWSERQYSSFARAVGLSASQFAGFQNAVAAHWIRWSEVVDVAREQGVATGDSNWAKLGKQEWTQYAQEVQEVIGSDAYRELQQFERRAPAKAAAETVAGLVFDSGEPLTAKQASALTEVLAQNSAKFRQGGPASLDDVEKPVAFDQLKDVLSPLQLAALQTSLVAREAGPRVQRLMVDALKQSPKGN